MKILKRTIPIALICMYSVLCFHLWKHDPFAAILYAVTACLWILIGYLWWNQE